MSEKKKRLPPRNKGRIMLEKAAVELAVLARELRSKVNTISPFHLAAANKKIGAARMALADAVVKIEEEETTWRRS